jgi:hypothetical protein
VTFRKKTKGDPPEEDWLFKVEQNKENILITKTV